MEAQTKIIVCSACRAADDAEKRPGALFRDALLARIGERNAPLTVEDVECLAVCKRPTTIAMAGAGKWTYLIGDLDLDLHVDDVIDAALAFGASENGIVPWKERPQCFRKGVVARLPPLN